MERTVPGVQSETALQYIFGALARTVKAADQAAPVAVADTLYYQHGSLRHWYTFDADSCEVLRRDRRDYNKERIIEVIGAAPPPGAAYSGAAAGLLRNVPRRKTVVTPAAPGMPVAVCMRQEQVDDDTTGLTLRYLDRAGLQQFLSDNREAKHETILQQLVYGKTPKASTAHVLWAPHRIVVMPRHNTHNVCDTTVPLFDRCCTLEAAPHVSKELKPTTTVVAALSAVCGDIAQHICRVEQRQVLRMSLTFSFDVRQRPVLLFASEVLLTTRPLTAVDARTVLLRSQERRLIPLAPVLAGGTAAVFASRKDTDAMLDAVDDPFRREPHVARRPPAVPPVSVTPLGTRNAADAAAEILLEQSRSGGQRRARSALLLRQGRERAMVSPLPAPQLGDDSSRPTTPDSTASPPDSPVRYSGGGGGGYYVVWPPGSPRAGHGRTIPADHTLRTPPRREGEGWAAWSPSRSRRGTSVVSVLAPRSLEPAPHQSAMEAVAKLNASKKAPLPRPSVGRAHAEHEDLRRCRDAVLAVLRPEVREYLGRSLAALDAALVVTDDITRLVEAAAVTHVGAQYAPCVLHVPAAMGALFDVEAAPEEAADCAEALGLPAPVALLLRQSFLEAAIPVAPSDDDAFAHDVACGRQRAAVSLGPHALLTATRPPMAWRRLHSGAATAAKTPLWGPAVMSPQPQETDPSEAVPLSGELSGDVPLAPPDTQEGAEDEDAPAEEGSTSSTQAPEERAEEPVLHPALASSPPEQSVEREQEQVTTGPAPALAIAGGLCEHATPDPQPADRTHGHDAPSTLHRTALLTPEEYTAPAPHSAVSSGSPDVSAVPLEEQPRCDPVVSPGKVRPAPHQVRPQPHRKPAAQQRPHCGNPKARTSGSPDGVTVPVSVGGTRAELRALRGALVALQPLLRSSKLYVELDVVERLAQQLRLAVPRPRAPSVVERPRSTQRRRPRAGHRGTMAPLSPPESVTSPLRTPDPPLVAPPALAPSVVAAHGDVEPPVDAAHLPTAERTVAAAAHGIAPAVAEWGTAALAAAESGLPWPPRLAVLPMALPDVLYAAAPASDAASPAPSSTQ